jgi:AraC-like DNA-binding protein
MAMVAESGCAAGTGTAKWLTGCRILRPPHLSGEVEITIADVMPRSFPWRVADALGICAKIGPAHQVNADGRLAMYPRDGVCVRAPGSVWCGEPITLGFVCIDIAPAALPQPGLTGAMSFLPPGVFRDVAGAARALMGAGSLFEAEEIVARLVTDIVDLKLLSSDALREASHTRRAIDRAREFLESRLDDRPSLEETARAASMNKFTLLRQFRKKLSTTPHAYLVMVRLNQARRLLARGGSPSEVAQATGFADQAHLTQRFKREYGVTPAVYAREARMVRSLPIINFVQD